MFSILFISASIDDFVDERALWFNLFQQARNDSPQILQSKAPGIHPLPRVSTSTGIWFGTKRPELGILSPRLKE
jgi:hypothetical protein